MKNQLFCFLILITLFSCRKKDDADNVIPKSPVPTIIDRPIGFSVTKGVFGNKIVLSWVAMPMAINYQVYKFDSASNDYLLFIQVNDTLCIDTTETKAYRKVFYKVRIFNSDTVYSTFSDVEYGYINGHLYDLVSTFGSQGTGSGQFDDPEHLAIDSLDNIYVCDEGLNRIQKFNKNGTFQEIFYSCGSPRGMLFLPDIIVLAKSVDNVICEMNYQKVITNSWGSQGTGDGQFSNFRQIAMDDEHNLYITDHNNNRIQKFDINGNYILKWGSAGYQSGQFHSPWGIAFINNMILVSSDKRVQFFTKTGSFIKQWDFSNTIYDLRVNGNDIYLACGSYIIKTNENRDIEVKIGEGDFDLVTSMVIDSEGNLFAVDWSKSRVSYYKKIN